MQHRAATAPRLILNPADTFPPARPSLNPISPLCTHVKGLPPTCQILSRFLSLSPLPLFPFSPPLCPHKKEECDTAQSSVSLAPPQPQALPPGPRHPGAGWSQPEVYYPSHSQRHFSTSILMPSNAVDPTVTGLHLPSVPGSPQRPTHFTANAAASGLPFF
jgi:hypothetical protein